MGSHGAVASYALGEEVWEAVRLDWRTAPVDERFRATLGFLEKLTLRPGELARGDALAVRSAGVTEEALVDAIHVGALFNMIDRLADSLGWDIPPTKRSPDERRRCSSPAMSWRRGRPDVLTHEELHAARERAAATLVEAGIVLTPAERGAIEVADFGLSRLDEIGLALVVYVNTDRVCAKGSCSSRARRAPSIGIRPRLAAPAKRRRSAVGAVWSTSIRRAIRGRNRPAVLPIPRAAHSRSGTRSSYGRAISTRFRRTRSTGSRREVREPSSRSSRPRAPTSWTSSPIHGLPARPSSGIPDLSVAGRHERRLHAPVVERLGEAVERCTHPDECFERVRPLPVRAVKRFDRGNPVLALCIRAAEEHVVLENRVDAEHAPVDLDGLLSGVDPEQARNTVAPEQAHAVGHDLSVAGRLHDEVEATHVLAKREKWRFACRDVVRAGRCDEGGAVVGARFARRRLRRDRSAGAGMSRAFRWLLRRPPALSGAPMAVGCRSSSHGVSPARTWMPARRGRRDARANAGSR